MVSYSKKIQHSVGVMGSVQATKAPGPERNARQLVARRINWTDEKEPTERQAAENFCKFTGRSSWTLEAGPSQDDEVDITARSPDDKLTEEFQIVRLWANDVWQKLNPKPVGTVDRDYTEQDAVALFRAVLAKKGDKKYPADLRKKITLLIDGYPIVNLSSFIHGIEDEITALARQAGYKGVWVIGSAEARQLA